MSFKKPCIRCGNLATTTPCPQCHTLMERQRNKVRDADPARAAKKASLYNTAYKKQRDLLKKTGGICYLCGEVVPAGTGQADHIFPSDMNSPLAITHSFCNQSKGSKPLWGG